MDTLIGAGGDDELYGQDDADTLTVLVVLTSLMVVKALIRW